MSDALPLAPRPGMSLAAFLVIAPLLGACSGEGGTESTASAPASEAPSALGACDLVTAAEVEAVLGGTAGEPKAGAPVTRGAVRLTDCTWIDKESGRSVTLILRRSESPDNTPRPSPASEHSWHPAVL